MAPSAKIRITAEIFPGPAVITVLSGRSQEAPSRGRTRSMKLFQEPHVILKQQPNIIQAVHQSAHAIDSEPKSKAGVFMWIDIDRAQHVRVDHARTTELNPAGVLADAATGTATLEATEIKLGAGFGERKIGRPEARARARAKHAPEKLG